MAATLQVSCVGSYSAVGLDPKDCIHGVQEVDQSFDIVSVARVGDIDIVGLDRRTLEHRGEAAHEDEFRSALLECGEAGGEFTLLHSGHEF